MVVLQSSLNDARTVLIKDVSLHVCLHGTTNISAAVKHLMKRSSQERGRVSIGLGLVNISSAAAPICIHGLWSSCTAR